MKVLAVVVAPSFGFKPGADGMVNTLGRMLSYINLSKPGTDVSSEPCPLAVVETGRTHTDTALLRNIKAAF